MEKQLIVRNHCNGMDPDEVLETILKTRGVGNVEEFLSPLDLEDVLNKYQLHNMESATEILLDAIKNNKKIFLNVDSDTDGVTSGAIMYRWLKAAYTAPDWHISQGKSHGTSRELIEKLSKKQYDVLIIVDSLDADTERYKVIRDMGIKIIVLDHHDIDRDVPYSDYITLVSSADNYDNPELAGAGVTWKFCNHMDEILGTQEAGYLMDLAACGLVSDMTSVLSEENRTIIDCGLKYANNLCIKKIVGGFDFNAQSFTFSVAPLVNATCRYSQNDLAFKAMISDDTKEISSLVKEMKKLKDKQNEEIADLMDDATEQAGHQEDKKVLFIVIETKAGIAGLLANKLTNTYQKPVIVVQETDAGYAGSARGYGVKDFKDLCLKTNLCWGQGHGNAFGIKISYEDCDAFLDLLNQEMKDITFKTVIEVDAEIDLNDISDSLIDEVKKIDRISGEGFPSLKFLVYCDSFEAETVTKGKHLRCNPYDGMAFLKWNSGNLIEEFDDYSVTGERVGFIGSLDSGFWGRKWLRKMVFDEYIVNEVNK